LHLLVGRDQHVNKKIIFQTVAKKHNMTLHKVAQKLQQLCKCMSRLAMGPTQPPNPMGTKGSFPRGEAARA